MKKENKSAHKETPASERVVKISTKGNVIKKLGVAPAIKAKSHSGTVTPAQKMKPANNLMISVSGIRGIVGGGLTPEILTKFSAAFGTWANGGKIVVGRDSRVSGEMVKTCVQAGLIATGCKIVDIGIVPTPTVEIAVKDLKAHGGISISASHNPLQWNALKLIGPLGLFLDQAQGNEVIEIADNGNIQYQTWDRLGKVEYYDFAVQNHIERILELDYINIPVLQERKFKVVVDCVNGAGGVLIPKLLRELGCDVISLNEDPHGIFPRDPEPSQKNLYALEEAVRMNQADVGFAVDPDVDRLAVVSNEGHAIGEEYTLALCVDFILSRKKGPVVVNASTSMAIDDIAKNHGCHVHRTRIGEINVSLKMRDLKASIGGEGNGGVILPEVHLGRDAATGIALILQHMCASRKTIAELWSALPQYVIIKEKIELGKIDVERAIEKILKDNTHNKIDVTDGVKIHFNHSWAHFRKSNTEPIIRAIVEAPSNREARELLASFTGYFK